MKTTKPTRNGVEGSAVDHAHGNGVRLRMWRDRSAEDFRPQREAKSKKSARAK